ncbi:hypothetical protein LR48_Vigan03g158500 [Vigna angularis]|uniref:Uncharacterized protein n=1 Tax=Phaseolus angularis TaxID=3914 RepID=A0A0L9U5U9_PHAAN|nr:hypothetical protein LR48_Vigan03g158500 [Vigna angularis]
MDDENEDPLNLRINALEEEWVDDKPLAKGPITRDMTESIQEEFKSFMEESRDLTEREEKLQETRLTVVINNL